MSSQEAEKNKGTEKKPCCNGKSNVTLYRASELPLYGNPNPPKDIILNEETGYIENGIRTVRLGVEEYLTMAWNASRRSQEIVGTAIAHSKSTYDYVIDEANTIPKAVAITGGGLIGLLLSSRKGFFKKLAYTSVGMASMAAACYPKQSQEMAQVGVYIVKNYGPEIIKDYTGVDLKDGVGGIISKIKEKTTSTTSEETSKSIGESKSTLDSSSSTVVATKPSEQSSKKETTKGDFGQGKQVDKDLYANRSTK